MRTKCRASHLPLRSLPSQSMLRSCKVQTPQGDRKGSSAKRSSTASFFKELPSWAKSYYARPDSTIFERSGSRTSADILNAMSGRKGSKDLLNEKGKGLSLAERGAAQRRFTKDWSPHLWHDRTSLGRRRSLFKAPSLDERAEGKALNKRNIQIALFAIGFIFPSSKYASFIFKNPPLTLSTGLVHRLRPSPPLSTRHRKHERQRQRPHLDHGKTWKRTSPSPFKKPVTRMPGGGAISTA